MNSNAYRDMGLESKAPTNSSRWGVVALGASILSNLLLIKLCLTYYSILNSSITMGSRVDSRGGLWEINILIPLLAVVAAIGGIVAANLKMSKPLATISASVGVIGWCCGLILVHFIRTSLQ